MSVHRGGRGPGHEARSFGAFTGVGGMDVTQRVLLNYPIIKLKDLNPFIRNDNNTASAVEVKIGPQALFKNDDNTWSMWFEAVQGTGYPTNNGMTAFCKATAPTLYGPWTIANSGNRVLAAADTTTWEYYEFSPATVMWDAPNSRLVAWTHGGNNGGPAGRQGGLAYSTDGKTGLTWVKEVSNPVITPGTTGAFDDKQAGGDLKWARNPITGLWVGVYRGQKSGSSQTDGTLGRVTGGYGTIPGAAVKTGQVISASPSFNTGGVTGGFIWYDVGCRLHGFLPCGSSAIGYYYSDDDGQSWTLGNSGAAIGLPSGTSGAYDQFGTGDVTQGVQDGDVLFLTFGVTNLTYPTNPALRGQGMAILPAPKVTPTRKGKFHLASARTDITAASCLNQTTYGIMGRFRAIRTDRTGVDREIFTEYAAFNKQIAVAVHSNNDANSGKLQFFHRTPTAIMTLNWSATVDDALWHKFLARRISTSSWEVIVDGGTAVTDPTAPGVDATATTKSIGNWPAARGADNPSNLTISDLGVVHGYAPTWAEASAWIDSRTALGGGSVVVNFPTDGAETGNVVTVEAA